ncbi:hypothetical protein BC6_00014 [Bacillus phage BC-6]|nr:hypothetical protein BC6_00014 [Bacillus phage BC-6]
MEFEETVKHLVDTYTPDQLAKKLIEFRHSIIKKDREIERLLSRVNTLYSIQQRG